MGIEGRVAVVTGATSGIGRGVAEHFASLGARVIVTGRNVDRGAEVVAGIRRSGGEAVFVAADLASDDCGDVLRDGVEASFGKVDILVNNGGTFFFKSTRDVSLKDFDAAVRLNLRGPFLVTQAMLGLMSTQQYGRVIFVSSAGASYGVVGTSTYAATKAAQRGLMYALVPEYGPYGITINTIEPGLIVTPLTSNLVGTEELQKPLLVHQPTGRVGVPLDVAHAALMFADDNAGHINGQLIILDGGKTRAAKHNALPPPPGSSGSRV